MTAGRPADPTRLRVGVIGSGRVGPVLAVALAGAGHRIVGITASDERQRDRVEAMLPGVTIAAVPEVIADSDLVLLAVPGAEIEPLVTGLARLDAWRPGQLVAHTAPEHGTGVLAAAVQQGVLPLAIHPAMVFTGTTLDLGRLRESVCAVTASAVVQPIGQALVVELGSEPVVIAEDDRPQYAEAVAVASQFSASIVAQSAQILRAIGVADPAAIVAPVMRSAVEGAVHRFAADSPPQPEQQGDPGDPGDSTPPAGATGA